MRNVLATDIKNNIRSIRFILGIFLIVSATLMSKFYKYISRQLSTISFIIIQ